MQILHYYSLRSPGVAFKFTCLYHFPFGNYWSDPQSQFRVSLPCHCLLLPPLEHWCLRQGWFHFKYANDFLLSELPFVIENHWSTNCYLQFLVYLFHSSVFLLSFHKVDDPVIIVVYVIQSCGQTSWSSWNFNPRFSRKEIRMSNLE